MPAVSSILSILDVPRMPRWPLVAEYGGYGMLAGVLAFESFVAGHDSLLFLLLPVMVLAAIRLGLGGAALVLVPVLLQAFLGFTQQRGALSHFPDPALALALFVIGCVAATAPAALLIRRRHRQVDARAAFLASMSHDIRTPMNGVLGFADLLRQGELTAEQRRSVDCIAESGQTMVRLLNDILDFSRLEAGRLELAREEVDLHAELQYAAALFGPRAREKGVALSCEIECHVPRMIRADGLRLRQVLLNLVGNAVKFTDHGHVRIAAHAHRGMMASELVVEVSDSGIGIAQTELGRIFEKYGQSGSAQARSRGGTGLGLAIARQLVELMDGKIAVQSTVGEGSCFTIRMPVQEVAQRSDPAPRLSAVPSARAAA